MRNVYFVYIFVDDNKAEIRHNRVIKTIEGVDILSEICLSEECIVFTNGLFYLTQRYPGGEFFGEDYIKYGKKQSLEYKYDKVTFRNIVCFTNGQSETVLQDLYPDVPVTEAMEMFINTLGPPEKVNYTLGRHVKKMFYAKIKKELWDFKKEHKAYYYNLDTYNDMMAGNKAGALRYTPVYAENVLCFDKRSAYTSVMVNDDKFPIGKLSKKTKIVKERNWYLKEKVEKYIASGTYFKVVCDYKIAGFEILYDVDAEKTALEYIHFVDLMECGKLQEFLDKVGDCWFYYCHETGRLPYILRQKIIESFNNKESMTGVAKFFEKTKINILYGKGIQHYDFKDKNDLQKHFRGEGRGDNYLQPEQSMHCAAVVMYEINKAIRNNVAVYWDTDGIKVQDTPEARCYFYEQNEIILNKNREAGFESEIGTWKLESECDEFIAFGPKQYIQKHKNGEYEMKWAGVEKRDQQKMLQCLGDDKIINALIYGVPVYRRYYSLNPENPNEIISRVQVEKKDYEGQ